MKRTKKQRKKLTDREKKLKAEKVYKNKLIKRGNNLLKLVCFKQNGSKCEVCGGNYLTTAHHYWLRSDAIHLIYEPLNFITLCCKCHTKLHFRDQKVVEYQIIAKRGKKWLNKLNKLKEKAPEGSFKTIQWIEEQIEKLNEINKTPTSE